MLTRALVCCAFALAWSEPPAFAQTGFANMVDHIHLGVPDQARGAEWYHTHFRGELTPEGPDRLMFGKTRMIFQKTPTPKPSEGSVLELIGFSVADLDATMKRLQADGVTVVMPVTAIDGTKVARVTDPWGTLIEVVQDPNGPGLHHIGLLSPNPTASLAWFADKFGGKLTKYKGKVEGVNYGGVWLFGKKGDSAPSAGHAIDHIGFRPLNVDDAVASLKAKNVKVTAEPRPLVLPSGTAMRLAFVESPDGVRLELVQRENVKSGRAQSSTAEENVWTPPRTPDGQPDFQGVWASATLTPVERPAQVGAKEFLTEQEAAEYERRTLEQVNSDRRDGGAEVDLRRNYNEVWRDRGTTVVASRRTSLIVDPPDGRIPAFTPERRRNRAARVEVGGAPFVLLAEDEVPSGPEDLPLRMRCISRDLPLIPTPNNNFLQIVQGPGFVAMVLEMMHEARLIPLDGRSHLNPKIRGYMGDSRGHWEGDTLVIDTTNFIGKSNFYGADDGLHLTERLTRTSLDTILYEFTVDDPTAFTRPWSGELPMIKSQGGVFEYACHEGNYSVTNTLAGARAAEKRAAGQEAEKGRK